MPQPRRKKWTEAEEKTLIDKYGEMVCDGTLAKMKTRERKHKPIALYVNSVHHDCDPITYPWQWTWKDVSTKVQNMRHQYSLVKQKIKKHDLVDDSGLEEFDWVDGLTHWSNFLRYKEVFGDLPLGNDSIMAAADDNNGNGNGEGFDGGGNGIDVVHFGHLGHHGDGDFVSAFDGGENGVMSLDFEYDGEEGDDNNHNTSINHLKNDGGDEGFVCEDVEPSGSDTRRKRKALKGAGKRVWGFLADQLGHLREMESRFERRDMERERERQRREHLRDEMEREREKKREKWEKEREERDKARDELRRRRIREWEAMEEEIEERERRRREDQMVYEQERERMSRRRSEWKKRIDDMLSRHRAETGQIQNRILHEQQNLTGQMLGIVSQWTGHPTGLSDPTGASNHYLSQMMQNLHHVNGIVHGDTRVDGDNQEDQFIVDG